MKEQYKAIDVENEKVYRIINCAFAEFSKHGYDRASTNRIVKEAGVSRGLLYHHFKDKEDLYDFLIDFSYDVSAKQIDDQLDMTERDLIQRIRQILVMKYRVTQKYPYMIEFYTRVIEAAYPGLRKRALSENIDFLRLKEGINVEMLTKLVTWAARGVWYDHWRMAHDKGQTMDFDSMLKDMDAYFDFIRTQYYKPAFVNKEIKE